MSASRCTSNFTRDLPGRSIEVYAFTAFDGEALLEGSKEFGGEIHAKSKGTGWDTDSTALNKLGTDFFGE